MKTFLGVVSAAWLCVAAFATTCAQEAGGLVEVKARDIKLAVPKSWKQGQVNSEMRAAQFEIPANAEGGEGAELVVYYFGAPTGGTRANIDRWIGQFAEQDRAFELSAGKCRQGSFVLADISGIYNKPVGPPAAGQTVETPESRVIGVVLIADLDGKEDYYFLKLAGPDQLVKKQAQALRTAIGADTESEKPVELQDIEN